MYFKPQMQDAPNVLHALQPDSVSSLQSDTSERVDKVICRGGFCAGQAMCGGDLVSHYTCQALTANDKTIRRGIMDPSLLHRARILLILAVSAGANHSYRNCRGWGLGTFLWRKWGFGVRDEGRGFYVVWGHCEKGSEWGTLGEENLVRSRAGQKNLTNRKCEGFLLGL